MKKSHYEAFSDSCCKAKKVMYANFTTSSKLVRWGPKLLTNIHLPCVLINPKSYQIIGQILLLRVVLGMEEGKKCDEGRLALFILLNTNWTKRKCWNGLRGGEGGGGKNTKKECMERLCTGWRSILIQILPSASLFMGVHTILCTNTCRVQYIPPYSIFSSCFFFFLSPTTSFS